MKTSVFLATLRAHPALPVVFRHDGDTIPAGYHLTEVKRVAYETMDCGAQTHRWNETQFELWAPPLNSLNPLRGHLPAGKLLAIVDRVEHELALNGGTDARIHARLGDNPPALWDIDSAAPAGGQLVVALTPDRTRCKAAERQVGRLTGGCCGSEPKSGGRAAPGAACGCSGSVLTPAQREAAFCCA